LGTANLLTLKDNLLRDPLLSKLSGLAKREDTNLFLVGGVLRDLLIGVHCRDYDLALSREASFLVPHIEEVVGFHFFKVGREDTITYRIIKSDMSIDLTYLQGDTIQEDLKRRDFTMNAIAFSLKDDTFHWVEGAPEDIERQVIRSVSPRAIDQDPLRMLRAIRYLSTLDGFRLDALLVKSQNGNGSHPPRSSSRPRGEDTL
jgi:tRNA nucleotidyltransferase/poly(A) polymerase